MDSKIQKSIWEGRIPIVFTLTTNEITVPKKVQPFYLMANRNSYFPLITQNIKEYFLQSSVITPDEIWFDHKSTTLKS